MPFQAKIKTIRELYGIDSLEEWEEIYPAQVLDVEGVGPSTLDHLRLYLAARGKTLRGDQTPAYWQARVDRVKIGEQLTDEDDGVACPFVILVDSMEQKPFKFLGFLEKSRPLLVETKTIGLGPAWGDYSIEGFRGRIHIERKSRSDFVSTVLGYGDRWERFERELEVLQGIESAAIVVECSLGSALASVQSTKNRTKLQNQKTVRKKWEAWAQDFAVPWIFGDTRRLAETIAFEWFDRWWRKRQEEDRDAAKAVKGLDEFMGI